MRKLSSPTGSPEGTDTQTTSGGPDTSAEQTSASSPDSTSPTDTLPDTPGDTQPQTTTTTLAPLRGLRYEPVFSDVRKALDHHFAMPVQIAGRPGGEYTYMITREGRVWIVEEDTFPIRLSWI